MESRFRIRPVRRCSGYGINICFNKVKVGDQCGHCIFAQRRERGKSYVRAREAAEQRLLDRLHGDYLKLQHERELFSFTQDLHKQQEFIRKEREALHAAMAGASQEVKNSYEELHQASNATGVTPREVLHLLAAPPPAAVASNDSNMLLEFRPQVLSSLTEEQIKELVRFIRSLPSEKVTPASLRALVPSLQYSDELWMELIKVAAQD